MSRCCLNTQHTYQEAERPQATFSSREVLNLDVNNKCLSVHRQMRDPQNARVRAMTTFKTSLCALAMSLDSLVHLTSSS